MRWNTSSDVDEASGEGVEAVGVGDVLVQTGRLIHGEHVNLHDAGIDAVGNRHVDEAVLAGDGHGRLATILGEREQAVPLPAA